MSKYIVLLRGINVSGARKVPMADLKKACQQAGFQNVQTYIQSGNVVFDSGETNKQILETKIQELITETFGFNDVPVIVRTAEEWAESIARNPFLKEEKVEIKKLYLTFLKELPSSENVEKISQPEFYSDRFQVVEKDVFVCYGNDYSQTKITNDFFEKKLKVAATTRNWNTVMKLNEMVK